MSRDPDPHDGVATLDAAHAYAARGWSVIPFEARSKRPGLAWLEFQRRIETQLRALFWGDDSQLDRTIGGAFARAPGGEFQPAPGFARQQQMQRERGQQQQ